MSSIDKMSVQGIRSFGPDDKEKQIIQFFTPLTLILGPNGTGKTTVIEALKYITTGVMPPGATRGGAFVHDPKFANEREVKAQIRLQFHDVSGQMTIVQRSMTATQKLKQVTLKTLDGCITRRNAAGEKKSISSKCAEIDKEMISALGVSKPVLENVIFCHQEEANWPLSEGKQLKDKFDDIFASTRYVKALETIRKLKMTQDATVKEYRIETSYLKQHKDKATQLEGDLNEIQSKLISSKGSVDTIVSKLDPIENKLSQIGAKSDDIYRLQNNITKHTSEKKEMERTVEELQKNIENEFQGSVEELKRVLAEFQNKVQEREDTLSQFKQQSRELERECEQLNRKKSELLLQVGKLEQEAQVHDDNITKRNILIEQFADKYQFEGFSGCEITDEKYRSFIENVRNKLETMVTEGKNLKVDFEEKEKKVQLKIDELKENKTKLEQSELIKRNMMKDNNTKVKQINQKLSQVDASAGKLEQLTRELKRVEHDLKSTEGTVDIPKLKQEIDQLAKDKLELDAKISQLSSEMNRLHLQSSAQAQIDVLKKDKGSKEENIRRLKAKQEDTISYLLGHMPTSNIRTQLDDYIGKQTESVKTLRQEVHQSKNQLSTKEAEKKMISETLRKKEEDLKNLEEKIFSVCGSQNFDDGLLTFKDKMSQTQDTRGSLLGAEHFFKKYATDLEKDDPCCPLCHREFDTDQEVKELVIELKNKLRMVPAKLQKAEKDLDEFRKKYDSMMQLKPLKENISMLTSKEIPELRNKLKKLNEDIGTLRTTIEEKEDDLQTKEGDEDMAKQVQPDVVQIDRYQGEVIELDKKITSQQSTLSGGSSDRTLQDVINEKEDHQMKVDTITKNLDRKRQKINDHSEELARLKSQINTLKEEKLQIDSDLQQRYKLEEDKVTLLSESDQIQREIQEASEQIRPLQNQIEKKILEKEAITAEKEDKIEQAKSQVDMLKNDASKVKNVNQEIKSYINQGKAETLGEIRKKKEQVELKTEKKETEKKEANQNITKIQNDLATQQTRERELLDNLQLRKKSKEIEDVKQKIADLKEQLGDIDVTHLDRERKRLQTQQEELMKEKHHAEGRQRGFEDQIRNIKSELKSDMYKGAPQKFRDKMIVLRTTELAITDLEKYYKALDTAIMRYHSLKMEEINKIIRELWRNTYRGNDIETIEIRTDEDESGIMKTRRNYNYRVVMIKGDTALDMRGRCSAGQKVLASLIIRLALAETFCLNCGILALDEPTTNLDRENIESLAFALVEIIKGRVHQKNFQLVIITHDEDFVELLGRSEYVDEFFKVRKDQSGYSQLVRARVGELHSR
ncbi:DNA repair protein RAD50-like [Mytilus trossulus]